MPQLNRISPKRALYIKLGSGGSWEKRCLEEGTIRIGYYGVPHEAALKGDKEAVRKFYASEFGTTPATATQQANQLMEFYSAGDDVIWITFSGQKLWWCFAERGVEHLSDDKAIAPYGSRLRRTKNGWHCTSISGTPLYMDFLNGALTKTAGYRQTICAIKEFEFDYLVRKINDEDLPVVQEAKKAKEHLLRATQNLLKLLQWRDFELLVDLIFSQSGWRRINSVGETQKTTDINLILPTTGERAAVQVKSHTTQSELQEYIDQFTDWDVNHIFYIYHSGAPSMCTANQQLKLIGPDRLADMILDAGLFDWLLKKVG